MLGPWAVPGGTNADEPSETHAKPFNNEADMVATTSAQVDDRQVGLVSDRAGGGSTPSPRIPLGTGQAACHPEAGIPPEPTERADTREGKVSLERVEMKLRSGRRLIRSPPSAESTRRAARFGGKAQPTPQELERRAVEEVAAEYKDKLREEEEQHAREVADLREKQETKGKEILELREYLSLMQERQKREEQARGAQEREWQEQMQNLLDEQERRHRESQREDRLKMAQLMEEVQSLREQRMGWKIMEKSHAAEKWMPSMKPEPMSSVRARYGLEKVDGGRSDHESQEFGLTKNLFERERLDEVVDEENKEPTCEETWV